MLRSISTHVFLTQRLTSAHLEAMATAGAESIELFAARHHIDYTDRNAVLDLASWFRSNPVGATLHMPLYSTADWGRFSGPDVNLIDPEKSRRISAMDEVKRALELAESLPIKSCVLHLGNRNELWSPRTLEHSLNAIEHLKAFAHPLGVQLLLENLTHNEVTTPAHLLEILTTGHFENVGVCFDIGHANISEQGIASSLETLASKIRELHLHDNAGQTDEHLWPNTGTPKPATPATATTPASPATTYIDWPTISPLLAALPNPVTGTLEIAYQLNETPTSVQSKAPTAFALFQQ